MERKISLRWLMSLLVVVLFLAGTDAFAANDKGAFSVTVPLTRFTPPPRVDLVSVESVYGMRLPIPERWGVESALLSLAYEHSDNLIPGRSRIVVFLNDQIIRQITLQPESPEGVADIVLPAKLLKAGYNDLLFKVYQTYTDEYCIDPSAPDLWTRLHFDKSSLSVNYDLKSVPLLLSEMGEFVFDDQLFGVNRLHIALEELTPEWLTLAAQASAGTALRFNYQRMDISVSGSYREGVDNIVIGSGSYLADQLKARAPEIDGPNLGVMHVPTEVTTEENGRTVTRVVPDTRYALVHASGVTPEEVARAVRALALISYPLPDLSSTSVSSVSWPEIDKHSGRLLLKPGERYLFKTLGFETVNMLGMQPGRNDLSFRIPSDALIKPNEYAEVSLHLVYGSGMRNDSVLNIFLNENFAKAIPLDGEKGGNYQSYTVTLPMYLFRRGYNTLSFRPSMVPLETGECVYVQRENLITTIYDDSKLKLPAFQSWVEMPEIQLFFQDGFPFSRVPDWSETVVHLAGAGPETASAALNILAMQAQKTGVPPFGVRFVTDLSEVGNKDILVVGSFSDLPGRLVEASPLSPEMEYAFNGQLPTLKQVTSWWDSMMLRIFPMEESYEFTSIPEPARVEIGRGLAGDKLLLMEFESPWQPMRTVLVVSGSTPGRTQQGSRILWDPESQFASRESLVTIRMDDPELKTITEAAGPRYFVGEKRGLNRVNYLLHTYPVWFFTILGVLILGLGVLLYVLIRTFRKSRLGNA